MFKKNIALLITILFPISSLLLSSCNRHYKEQTFKNEDITVTWYKKGTITTTHDYIDMERYEYTDKIMHSNIEGIYDVSISGDTITIKTLPGLVIYDLAAIKNGCIIRLDTTVTMYDYKKKFYPDYAKYFVDDTIKSK